jgi:hypothetical protein
MDGVISRLSAAPTPAAEPKPAAGVVATPTANGGVTVRKTEETTAANEETLILGKFKDQSALEKAYTELEKKLGGKKEEPAAPASTPTPAAPASDAAAAAQKAGLDLKALGDEYIAGGKKLSEASMAKLAAAGITEAQVSQYIAGQEALGKQVATDLAAAVGGEDKLNAVLEWAKANASKDQKDAFDAALDTGNPALVKLALAGIQADYVKAVGSDPKLIAGEPAGGPVGVQPFGSQQEMVTAMKDPRYKKGDVAYMKLVQDRIKASRGKLWGKQG